MVPDKFNMVPDKFNMVDMGGIDVIRVQGLEVEGLYDKLVESILSCRYQCLYNWYFDGILIPPTYVELSTGENVVYINSGISVDSDDIVHIGSIEYAIEPLTVTQNGTYEAQGMVAGYNPVSVSLQFSELSVSENGVYTPENPVKGFSKVTVNTHVPVMRSLSVTENGLYIPQEGVDGFNSVDVNVLSGNEYTNYEFAGRSLYTFNTAGEKLCTANSRGYYKITSDVAYGCYPRPGNGAPFLISTIADAVKYRADSGGPFSYAATFTYDGVTWYVSASDHGWSGDPLNTNGPLLDFHFSQTSNRANMGLEFLESVLRMPTSPIQVFKPTTSGVIYPPEGYTGFGVLYIE